jgi:hypothetical protein
VPDAEQREPATILEPLLHGVGLLLGEPSGRHGLVDLVGDRALHGRLEVARGDVQALGHVVEERLAVGRSWVLRGGVGDAAAGQCGDSHRSDGHPSRDRALHCCSFIGERRRCHHRCVRGP